MFKPSKGICSCHGETRWIINKRGECISGRNERNGRGHKSGFRFFNRDGRKKLSRGKKANVPKTGTNAKASVIPRTKFKKPTGEKKLFEEIWQERDPWCEWCGTPIIEFSVANYHHVKPKSKYPELRLVKSNIVKICFQCHFKTHNQSNK